MPMPSETLSAYQSGLPPIGADLVYRDLVLDTVLTFGRSEVDDLELLRYLRDATSHGVRLRWRLAGVPTVPLRQHVHLVAPSGGVDPEASAYAARWTAGYRYGAFYFRQGPGFVVVKDVRPDGEHLRLTIDDGAEHFLAMYQAHRLDDLDQPARELVDAAAGAGLLVRAADRLMVLPYRLRHWPVPYLAV